MRDYNSIWIGYPNLKNDLYHSLKLNFYSLNLYSFTNIYGIASVQRRYQSVKNQVQFINLNNINMPFKKKQFGMSLSTRLILLLIVISCSSETMSQQTAYYPPHKASVSKADFEHGTKVLKNTYSRIKRRNGRIQCIDYWNIAVGYTYLQENKDTIRGLILRSYQKNPELFLMALNPESNAINLWRDILPKEEFSSLFGSVDAENYRLYHGAEQKTAEEGISQNALIQGQPKTVQKKKYQYDEELKQLMKKIDAADQAVRGDWDNPDLEQMRIVDERNLKTIDSLYNIYQTYIGKTMVGDDYEHVMWLVIQHADLATMERYLPVLHTAIQEDELSVGAFKMTLDRIYAIKFNYQIYGSQYAVPAIPIAPDHIVKEVKQKYQLD